MRTEPRDLADRVVGVLFGLAAGDRIGGPVRMALRVAESLRDRGAFDAPDIGRRYVDWWKEGAFDTGPTVARVLSLVAAGAGFEPAAILADQEAGGMTAGCNPAHRVAPLAMCAAIGDADLGRAAGLEAGLTHRHPLAGDVAAAVARLCRVLIRGVPWTEALQVAAQGRRPETCRALTTQPVEGLSREGFAPAVLTAAVRLVEKATNFPDALGPAVEFAGPANYCPVLVGSISGARWGRSKINPTCLDQHGGLIPRLSAAAEALAGQWSAAAFRG